MDDAWQIAHRVYPAYRELGELAFVYGQGSAFAGFNERAGVDLVAVWDRPEPPEPEFRPVDRLHQQPGAPALTAPVRLHHPRIGLVRDSFGHGGREVVVSHITMAEVKRWIDEVQAGQGWEHVVRPTPLHAVAAFCYGALLHDEDGHGAAWREELREFPIALVERSRDVLSSDLRAHEADLERCARAGDGWQFHEIFGDMLRHALVAWFAAERRYCPYPKWVRHWVSRFAMNPSIAALERGLWAPPVSLHRRHEIFVEMCRRIVAL